MKDVLEAENSLIIMLLLYLFSPFFSVWSYVSSANFEDCYFEWNIQNIRISARSILLFRALMLFFSFSLIYLGKLIWLKVDLFWLIFNKKKKISKGNRFLPKLIENNWKLLESKFSTISLVRRVQEAWEYLWELE